MPITPAGSIAYPVARLSEVLVELPEFQAWAGADYADRVHLHENRSLVEDEGGAPVQWFSDRLDMPFALLWMSELQIVPPYCEKNLYSVMLLLQDLPKDIDSHTESYLTFSTEVGGIIDALALNVIELSGTSPYPAISRIEMPGTPGRVQLGESGAYNDFWTATFMLILGAGGIAMAGADVFINADYTGWFAEFANRRGGRGISRDAKSLMLTTANRKAVLWWHRKIIPLHFDASAQSRYHYKKRKDPYRGIKKSLAAGEEVFLNGRRIPPERIVKGGDVDIVRKGETEAKAENPVPVRSSPNVAVATLRVPKHILRQAGSDRPDQKKEIKTRTKAETAQIVRVWKKTFLAGARVIGSRNLIKRRYRSRV